MIVVNGIDEHEVDKSSSTVCCRFDAGVVLCCVVLQRAAGLPRPTEQDYPALDAGGRALSDARAGPVEPHRRRQTPPLAA